MFEVKSKTGWNYEHIDIRWISLSEEPNQVIILRNMPKQF